MRAALNPRSPLAWAVVVAVGAAVVILTLALGLFGRFDAGQKVLSGAAPAFTDENVTGARAGIDAISVAVDTADPIVTENGGAAAEVPQLIAFVSEQTGLSEQEVLAALQEGFPHTTALLQAAPLSGVTAELPKLVDLLATTLNLTPDQVLAALQQNFPRLAQAVASLPAVTGGWDAVPGIDGLTRFDGSPVVSVPDIRDYFSADVIPVVEEHRTNFQHLDRWVMPTDSIAPVLVIIGGIVMIWGSWFLARALSGRLMTAESALGWFVVPAVGLAIALVVGLFQLFPALDGGQKMVEDLRAPFADSRIQADVPAIGMVSTVVDLLDPITTAAGGAAEEVPQLIGFVSDQTGLSQADVLAALRENVPQTAALLQALPLSAVSDELPGLQAFLAETLGLTQDELGAALGESFPRLAQSIANLPALTAVWDRLPGAPGFVRFDGAPIENVTGVRDYFGVDVIPMLAAQQRDFERLDRSPPLTLFAPLLLAIGVVVLVFGTSMLLAVRAYERDGAAGAPTAPPLPTT